MSETILAVALWTWIGLTTLAALVVIGRAGTGLGAPRSAGRYPSATEAVKTAQGGESGHECRFPRATRWRRGSLWICGGCFQAYLCRRLPFEYAWVRYTHDSGGWQPGLNDLLQPPRREKR